MQPLITCSMPSLLLSIISFYLISNHFTIIIWATSRTLQSETPRVDSSSNTTDFIKSSCQTTKYADLCFKTLSPYAAIIGLNPMELANAALTVSLKSAKLTSKIVRGLSKGRGLSMRDGQAVADCLENISDSVDEMKRSVVEMKGLDGPEFDEKMGNVKTWVSAALTDEDTCMDGFEENDGSMKETIRGFIVNVAELTSNALALITNLSST